MSSLLILLIFIAVYNLGRVSAAATGALNAYTRNQIPPILPTPQWPPVPLKRKLRCLAIVILYIIIMDILVAIFVPRSVNNQPHPTTTVLAHRV